MGVIRIIEVEWIYPSRRITMFGFTLPLMKLWRTAFGTNLKTYATGTALHPRSFCHLNWGGHKMDMKIFRGDSTMHTKQRRRQFDLKKNKIPSYSTTR